MTRYFIFPTAFAADATNDRVSRAREPLWKDGITERAMAVIHHPDGRVALSGDERHAPHLTHEELALDAQRARTGGRREERRVGKRGGGKVRNRRARVKK